MDTIEDGRLSVEQVKMLLDLFDELPQYSEEKNTITIDGAGKAVFKLKAVYIRYQPYKKSYTTFDLWRDMDLSSEASKIYSEWFEGRMEIVGKVADAKNNIIAHERRMAVLDTIVKALKAAKHPPKKKWWHW